jgi:hypothetical protein
MGLCGKTVETTGFEPSWRTSSGTTVPGPVTSKWESLRASVRLNLGRSDRSAQGDRSTLRSIRPTRATTSLAASVDHTEARGVAGFGPDDCVVRPGGNPAKGSSEVRPWDRTFQGAAGMVRRLPRPDGSRRAEFLRLSVGMQLPWGFPCSRLGSARIVFPDPTAPLRPSHADHRPRSRFSILRQLSLERAACCVKIARSSGFGSCFARRQLPHADPRRESRPLDRGGE